MRFYVSLVFLLTLVISTGAWALENQSLPLPLDTKGCRVPALGDRIDSRLQMCLNERLSQDPAWRKLIRSGKMAVGLVDLSNPDRPLFARVNGDHMMYAASLPKIAVLLAAFHALEQGWMEESPELIQDLNLMIRKSNNQAATRVIERIGMRRIQHILTLKRYGFYEADNGGGLWVGKKYAKTGPRIPDPVAGVSHGATAAQVCRFYYLLAMGKLISPEKSREMLEILNNPGLHHKFVNTLDRIAPDAFLFRKSGTWKTFHSDSVLVWGENGRRYIAVALVEDQNGEMTLRKLIPELEAVLRARRTS